MSDDITIPRVGPTLSATHQAAPAAPFAAPYSYRARRQGMDRNTKRLLLAAGVLGSVLVGGMAYWSLTGHRPQVGVPRIEADGRPMRVKPDDPGGMTAGAAFEQAPANGDVADLAPAAERPDPQALLAQRSAAVPPRIAPPAPAPAAAPAAPRSEPAPPQASAPPAAAPPSAAPAPAHPAPAHAAEVGTMIQLASMTTEAAANAEWQRLSRKAPELLGSRRPVIQRAELNGRATWRLRTGGFNDTADATSFCKQLRAKGADCSLANF